MACPGFHYPLAVQAETAESADFKEMPSRNHDQILEREIRSRPSDNATSSKRRLGVTSKETCGSLAPCAQVVLQRRPPVPPAPIAGSLASVLRPHTSAAVEACSFVGSSGLWPVGGPEVERRQRVSRLSPAVTMASACLKRDASDSGQFTGEFRFFNYESYPHRTAL